MLTLPIIDHWLGLEARRKRLLKKAPAGPLRDYLAMPFPSPDTPLDRCPILAVDFETTGLHPESNHIVSIGHVCIDAAEILLGTARHVVIRGNGDLHEENVAIHRITDSDRARGEALETAVGRLLTALAGRVMLVHFGRIERDFLSAACRHLYGMAPVLPMIDTLQMAKRRMDMRSAAYDPSELRLFRLREHHGLPRYTAHNALLDAISTAELFLVETSLMNRRKAPPLRRVLRF